MSTFSLLQRDQETIAKEPLLIPEEFCYFVDNGSLQSEAEGIHYCRSMSSDDQDKAFVRFGEFVRGIPMDNWLRIRERRFLPMTIEGHCVLSLAYWERKSDSKAGKIGRKDTFSRTPQEVQRANKRLLALHAKLDECRKHGPEPPHEAESQQEKDVVIPEKDVVEVVQIPWEASHVRCPRSHYCAILNDPPPAYDGCPIDCNGCGAQDIEKAGMPFFHCGACEYDLCQACGVRLGPASRMCDAAHKYGLNVLQIMLAQGHSVNVTDHQGLTPLMLAAKGDHIDRCVLLLEARADASQVDHDGCTAMHHARSKHTRALLDALDGQAFDARKFDRVLDKLAPSICEIANKLFDEVTNKIKAENKTETFDGKAFELEQDKDRLSKLLATVDVKEIETLRKPIEEDREHCVITGDENSDENAEDAAIAAALASLTVPQKTSEAPNPRDIPQNEQEAVQEAQLNMPGDSSEVQSPDELPSNELEAAHAAQEKLDELQQPVQEFSNQCKPPEPSGEETEDVSMKHSQVPEVDLVVQSPEYRALWEDEDWKAEIILREEDFKEGAGIIKWQMVHDPDGNIEPGAIGTERLTGFWRGNRYTCHGVHVDVSWIEPTPRYVIRWGDGKCHVQAGAVAVWCTLVESTMHKQTDLEQQTDLQQLSYWY